MAVYPIAAGQPDYSGNIIPTLWSRKLLERFYDAAVVPAISTTDYLGEIKNMGDTVVINQVPDITITPYKMGDNLTNQRPTQTTLDLMIDQGNYWSFILDDVADAQAMFNMTGPWADNASEKMKITVDTEVLAFLRTRAAAANKGATAGRISANINLGATGAPLSLTPANIIDTIIDLGLVLDEQNIPETGRKLVMPMSYAAMLKKSDLATASYIYGVHPMALTFATQLVKSETSRSESTFGTIMRGLQVYGRGVPQPTVLATAYAVKG